MIFSKEYHNFNDEKEQKQEIQKQLWNAVALSLAIIF